MSARNENAIVVTGTDTGIGKTVFAAALAGALGASYWKPVQAGLDGETDSATVARLSGGRAVVLAEAYSLRTPASPHHAAAQDGVAIDPEALSPPTVEGSLVIEGAGGALVPIDGTTTYADIFARWALPTIVVAPTRLGTINHCLLTIEALRARDVPLLGVAFVGEEEPVAEEAVPGIGRARHLGRLPRLDPLDADSLARAFAARFDVADLTP